MTQIELTPRERQVCELIRSGFTDMQIAAKLNIEYCSAVSIVRNLRAKLVPDDRNNPRLLVARVYQFTQTLT